MAARALEVKPSVKQSPHAVFLSKPPQSQERTAAQSSGLPAIQRKLKIGSVNDPLEREADHAAERVMRSPDHPVRPGVAASAHKLQRKCSCGGSSGSGGECEDCKREHEGTLQRAAAHAPALNAAPAVVHDVLRSPGRPLDSQTREFFEPRFGWDFSRVRVHADEPGAASAEAVGARAYTVGNHIAFGAGQFAPNRDAGRRLLAHELTHVVQQEGSPNGALRRQPKEPGVCDTGNLATLGPDFVRSEADVKKLKLPERMIRTKKGVNERDFVLYCPHRSSIALGSLVPGSPVYYAGSGKAANKDEVWARMEDHEQFYFLGFMKNDKYENIRSVTVPEDKIAATPKKGVCGPDLTKQLTNGMNNLRRDFHSLDDRKEEMCDQLHDSIHGLVTWDFSRLHVRGWLDRFRDKCATMVSNADEPCCANSVQINDDCYYGGSPNYAMFGAMCRLCFDHYVSKKDLSSYYFTSKSMLNQIQAYKSDAWNFKNSEQWAMAGYNGWPSGGSPPSGDCSKDCSVSCPTPFGFLGWVDKEALRARWCPYIDPLNACQSKAANARDLAKIKAQSSSTRAVKEIESVVK